MVNMRSLLPALLVVHASSGLAATTPYRVVALDPERMAVIQIDMDTGEQTVDPIPTPWRWRGPNQMIAASPEGLVYVMPGWSVPPVPAGILDTNTHEWTLLEHDLTFEFPDDMDMTPSGNLIVSADYGIGEFDPSTFQAVAGYYFRQPRNVEVDSTGRVITFTSVEGETSFQMQVPGTAQFEALDIRWFLDDYVLESDTSMIADAGSFLRRIDLQTGDTEIVYQGVLGGKSIGGKLAIDPQGRIIGMREGLVPPPSPDQYGADHLVRIDLTTGTEEIVPINGGYYVTDLDILLLPEPVLQAGDADQDYDVDQLDLVWVQIAAKYLTGLPATWGQGDWNGAPGGRPGEPPAGDGLFNQLDVVAALQAGKYLTGPYGVVGSVGRQADSQTSIVYDPRTGELAVDAPAGHELTSINIDSAAGIFTGLPARNLGGSFDHHADTNIFKATFGGSFGSLTFGPVSQPGLAEDFLRADLSVIGSLAGGGGLGDVDLIYVPEPSGLMLAVMGLCAALPCRSRRRTTRR